MSDPALSRKVRVCALESGAKVPDDGRIYRDSDGKFFVCIHYVFKNEKDRAHHFWKLAQIAAHEARNKK